MKKKMIGAIVLIILILIVIVARMFLGKGELGKTDGVQGIVMSANEQGMEIELMTIRTEADGSIVGISGVGNPTKEILFQENTIVVINQMTREVDDSVTTEQVEGNLSDIVSMSSVTVYGSSTGGKNYAEKIEIWVNVN